MESGDARRGFLLGITLNELAFLLFFLLLLVSAMALRAKDANIERKEEQLRDRKIQVTAIETKLNENFKELVYQEKVIARLTGLSGSISQEELDSTISKLVEVERISSELIEAKNEAEQLAEKNAEYENAIQRLEDRGITGRFEEIAEQCFSDIKNTKQLKGELAWTTKQLEQCAGNGLDHPPCWPDKQGKPEYMYKITIYENKLRVDGIWPKNRQEDAVQIPGVEGLANRSVSIDEFTRLAAPIKEWSIQHNCRHHVRIYVDETTSMNGFRRNMLTVEDYFYKWLSRN